MELVSPVQIAQTFFMILFGSSVSVSDRRLDIKCDNFETYESRVLAIQPYAIFNDSIRVYPQCCNLCAAFAKCASFNYDLKTHTCSLLPEASEKANLTQSPSTIHGKFVTKEEQNVKENCKCRPCPPGHLCLSSASGHGYSCLKGSRCSDAPPLDHMTTDMGLITMTSGQANYTCDTGFRRDTGSGHSFCTVGKGWTAPSLVCTVVDCGHPPAHDNKKVTSVNSTLYQARVEYTCDPGYNRTEGNQSSFCQANGTWSVPTLKCQAVDCGIPAVVEHLEKRDFNGTTYMSQVNFICSTGFTSDGGNPTIECLANGTWSQPVVVCKRVDCGHPPDLGNINVTSVNSTLYQTHVEYTCDPGYTRTEGNQSSFCQSNGTWSVPTLKCQGVDCGHPPARDNKKVTFVNSTMYQTHVEYTCDPGYTRTEGNQSSFCQLHGTWSVPTLKCQAVDCGIPADVEHMKKREVNGTTYKSQVTFTCSAGFTSDDGNQTIECMANGTWSQSALDCKRIDCGHPPAHDNKNVTSVNSTLYLARVEYTCDPGYTRTGGNHSSSCQANGTWTVPTLECEAVDCGIPADVEHMEKRVKNGTTYKSQVTFTCSAGFFSDDGDQTIECLGTGTWSHLAVDCKRKDCKNPPENTHMVVNVNSTLYESKAIYACEIGYNAKDGDGTVFCKDDAQWTKPTLDCQIMNCAEPVDVKGLQLNPVTEMTNGSVATYVCALGYKPMNNQQTTISSTCMANGTWSLPSMECTASPTVGRCCKIPGLQCEYVKSIATTSSVSCYKNFQLLGSVYAVCCSHDQLSCYVKEEQGPPMSMLQIGCEPGEIMTACSGFHRGKGTLKAMIKRIHGIDTCMIPQSGGSHPHLTGYVSCCKY